MAQNEIRGTTQIKAGTVPSTAVQTTFFTDVLKSQYWTGGSGVTDFALWDAPDTSVDTLISCKVYLRGIRVLDGWSIVEATPGNWVLRFAVAPETDDMVLIEYLKAL